MERRIGVLPVMGGPRPTTAAAGGQALGHRIVGVWAPEKRGTPAIDDAGGSGGVPPPAPLEVGGTETPVEVKPEI